MIKACGILLGCILFNGFLYSQHLPLREYTVDDGLVSNDILTIFQDSRGYLWIGTGEGLSQYDGYSFTNYRATDGLASNYITCIAESRSDPGVMWFGTWGRGLTRYENGAFSLFDNAAPELTSVVTLCEDSRGTLWCGAVGATFTIRNDSLSRFCVDGLDVSALYIVQPGHEQVWLGSDTGVVVVSTGNHHAQRMSIALSHGDEISCMRADADGTVWIGTEQGELLRYRDTALISRRSIGHGRLRQVVDDHAGTLWVCTQEGLLMMPKDGNTIVRYTVENGLSNNFVGPALFDAEGNLWFSCSRAGVLKWAHRGIFTFPLAPFLSDISRPVLAFAATDNSKHLWVTAGDGVWEYWKEPSGRWLRKRQIKYTEPRTIPISVHFDRNWRLWTVTASGSTVGYQVLAGSPSTLVKIRSLEAGVHYPDDVVALGYIDSRDRFWYHLRDGSVAVLDPAFQFIRRYGEEDGIPGPHVRTICEDHDGNIWFGVVVGGVCVLMAEEVGKPSHTGMRRFTRATGLPDESIRAMTVDRRGRVLIGTRYGGMAVYENGEFRTVSMSDGLVSNAIFALVPDSDSLILVGTGSGLQDIDARTLKPSRPIRDLTGQIVYTCGVVEGEFAWSVQAGPVTNTLKLHEFKLSHPNDIPPPVYVTEFRVNSNVHDIQREMKFHYDHNTFSIKFAGLSFKDERETRFQYRLVGADGNWNMPTSERLVTYAGLAPGSYTFEVAAFNNDGVRSKEPATVSFTVMPPYWKTWWFYGTVLIVAGAGLWALYNYRVSRILELERIRLRIARDLHDDVGGTLSGIAHLAEAAAGEADLNGSKQRILQRIAESSSEVQAALDDIVWSLNPVHDTWESLIAKCRRFASDLCEAKNIAYTIDMPTVSSHLSLPLVVRKNLWLIYKEIVTNAVRHSCASRITVELTLNDSAVALFIEDDGQGFDPTAETGRNGVRNIRQRAESLRATADLRTSPGQGTRWAIRFRIP